MAKTKAKSTMITQELQLAIRNVVLQIPRAKRKELAEQITLIQSQFQIDEDLVNYTAQGKHWANRSEEEVTAIKQRQVEKTREYARKHSEELKKVRAEAKAQRDRKYKVEWRGQGSTICTLKEAADVVGISEHALRLRLHKSKNGLAAFNIEEQVVTVYKPKP